MSDTLYGISEEINIFMRNWEQSQAYDEEKGDGTISFNAQGEFEALYEKLNKKLNSFVGYIRSIEDQIIAIDRKQAELQAMKIKKQKKIDSMMSLLKFIMEKQNITEIDTGENFIKLKESRGAVNILDESSIPDEYMFFSFDSGKLQKDEWDKLAKSLREWRGNKIEVLPNRSVNKTGIQNSMKLGAVVPGVEIKKERSVVIV